MRNVSIRLVTLTSVILKEMETKREKFKSERERERKSEEVHRSGPQYRIYYWF